MPQIREEVWDEYETYFKLTRNARIGLEHEVRRACINEDARTFCSLPLIYTQMLIVPP